MVDIGPRAPRYNGSTVYLFCIFLSFLCLFWETMDFVMYICCYVGVRNEVPEISSDQSHKQLNCNLLNRDGNS